MKLLTNEQQNSYQKSKMFYICKEKIEDNHAPYKKYHKFSYHFHYMGEYRGATSSLCNLK